MDPSAGEKGKAARARGMARVGKDSAKDLAKAKEAKERAIERITRWMT